MAGLGPAGGGEKKGLRESLVPGSGDLGADRYRAADRSVLGEQILPERASFSICS